VPRDSRDWPRSASIGAWGAKLATLAGAIATEVKVGGSANPTVVGIIRAAVSRGEAAAGRPTSSVGIALGAVTVVDEDGARARELARQEVARYLPVVAALDRFAFAGTPEQIVRQTEAILAAGAARVEFGTPHGLNNREGLRLLGTRVLPAFR
jgi:5,10-methylenetetrahydromethanopterin reductase